jgi:hypothetical protein
MASIGSPEVRRVFLSKHMIRTKVKGTRFKAASNPENEPNFYSMPVVEPLASVSTSYDTSQRSLTPIPVTYHSFAGASTNIGRHVYNDTVVLNAQAISSSVGQFLAPYCKSEVLPASPIISNMEAVSSSRMNSNNNEECLDDFSLNSLEWDDGFDSAFEMSLNNDVQLGYMLEKLLED